LLTKNIHDFPMKTLAKITVVSAGLLAAAIPGYAATKEKAGAADRLANRPLLRALVQRRAAVRAQVAKRLDLSADQVAQLKARRASTADALKAIRKDSTLTAEQKKAKARETLQAARADVRATLTPEQQSKLAKIRARLQKAAGKRGLL
jgi:hypothetical protein